MESKVYDFSQIKGDFISIVELNQLHRENQQKKLCSSIFVSLHTGAQVVLWEVN
jgi:hypothetical protein